MKLSILKNGEETDYVTQVPVLPFRGLSESALVAVRETLDHMAKDALERS